MRIKRDDECLGQRYTSRAPHPLAVVAIGGMRIEHRVVSTPQATARRVIETSIRPNDAEPL